MKRTAAILTRLNPVAMFFGPVFQKDVRISGRGKGAYWTRAVYTLILLAILSVAFVSYGNQMMNGGPAVKLQQMQTLAPTIAITAIWTQFVLLLFISPILTAGSICDEKRARTMSALMTTPLTSAQIVGGKLMSGLVQITILALIMTPILLVIRIFGGLDTQVVLAATLAVISTSVLGASLGVLFSCWNKNTSSVVIMAILTTSLIQATPIVVTVILMSRGVIPDDYMPFIVLTTCSPVILAEAMANLMGEEFLSMVGQSVVPWKWTLWRAAIANSVYLLSASALVVLWATMALRKTMLLEAAGAVKMTRRERKELRRSSLARSGQSASDEQMQGEAAEHAVEDTAPPAQEAVLLVEAESREVSDRPILWRELQRTGLSGQKISIRLQGLTLAAVALIVALLILSFRVSELDIRDFATAIQSSGASRFFNAIAMLVQFAIVALVLGTAVWRFRKGISITMTKPAAVYGLIVAGFLSYIYIVVGFDNSGAHIFVGVVVVVGAIIMASVKTASGISGERELRTWDVLLTTTLSSRDIILGKYIGAVKTQLILPAILLGHLVLATIFGTVNPIAIPQAMLIVLGPILFLSATGVLFSLMFKKTTTAGVCNMGLALGVWLGTWIVLGLVSVLMDYWDNSLFESATDINLAMSPPGMIAAVTEANAFDNAYGANSYRSKRYEYFSDSMGHVTFSTIVFAVFVVYSAMAYGAIMLAESLFYSRSGRAS